MSRPRRILIIRLSSVGDIVLAGALVQVLAQREPQARLDFLVDKGFASLPRGWPELEQIHEFDHRGEHRGPGGIRLLAEQIGSVDWVLDLQHKLRSQMLLHWLKPARKTVYVKRKGMGMVRAMLGADAVLGGPHQIQRYLGLLEPGLEDGPGPMPRLSVPAEPAARARRELGLEQGQGPVLGLVLGGRHATKRWPATHWASLARLALDGGLRPVLLGGPDGLEDAQVLRGEFSGLPLGLDGDLERLAARLSCCDVVVCPDSGPGHMAAALGLSTISLFGPTSPRRWAPRGPRVEVLGLDLNCAPCSNHGSSTCPLGSYECMRELDPQRVWEAVRRGLED